MADLIDRFRSLDLIDSPDLWGDAERRSPRSSLPPKKSSERVVAVVVAFAVAAAAIAFAVRALGGGTSGRPADQPSAFAIQQHSNGVIYFRSGIGYASTVDAMNPDGSGRSTVFGGNTFVEMPAWSPDGSRIAYVGLIDSGPGRAGYGIFTSRPDGSGKVQLTSGPIDGWPAWSPDGTKVAFSAASADTSGNQFCTNLSGSPGCPTDIYVINADGSGLQQLSGDPAPEFNPQWSPDGTKIAFVRTAGESEDILVMNAGGTGVTTVARNTGGNESRFSWSPDGKRIAFVSFAGTGWGIHVVNADGTDEQVILERKGVVNEDPVWSPDGSRIAFASTLSAYPPGCGQSSDVCSDLFTMRPDGSDIQQLTHGSNGVTDIAWQPLPFEPSTQTSTSQEPQRARVGDPIHLGQPGTVDSVAYGEGSVWARVAEEPQAFLVRLDPQTQEITARIPVPAAPHWEVGGGGIVAANGVVWVAGEANQGSIVAAVDPSTNLVVQQFQVPGNVADLAAIDSQVWVLGNQNGTPYLGPIDEDAGRFVQVFPRLPGRYGRTLAVADGYLFAAVETGSPAIDGTTVLQINPAERSLMGGLALGSYSPIVSDGLTLWAAPSSVVRLEIDGAGDIIKVPLDDVGATGDAVTAGEGHVWFFGAAAGRALGGYNPATGNVDIIAKVGGVAMAVSRGAVWVVDGQSLTRVDLG
ncbi:MAG: hypothetical protein M3O88_01960 [Actinomycetota bacterium]|nr:hypothetical protein [Actinomycetota bacterium]